MRRSLILVVVIALATAGCVGLDDPAGTDGEGPQPDPSGELELHHIDVGQADATLIITPEGETILIDTGDWREDGDTVIQYLQDHGIERIDHLVATHGHADHIGGHAAIIEEFETEQDGVGAAYDNGVPSTSQTYENYLDAIEDYEVDLFEVGEDDTLPLEDENVTATVLNPEEPGGDDLHYNSITLRIDFGEIAYLTTGDAETDAEQRMVDEQAGELDADIYQAGHHGSDTSSTEPFLDAVDPEYAVISSDYDSQYGHPNAEVLERFDEYEITTYWTGVHNTTVMTTDGESIDAETERTFSTAPLDLLEESPTASQTQRSVPAP